ncbi:MAG: MBL fold metallo-hydrolase [Gemmataceae bacterium]
MTVWGAARAVTGSMHLVEACGKRVLLDCGQSRGTRNDTANRAEFPFEPSGIDAVVLSHAHTDHCGFLPALVRQGFDGPIYCTAATRELTEVMLIDSARIQEERAMMAAAGGRAAVADHVPFSRADVYQTIDQCVPLNYGQPHTIGGIQFQLLDAGHLLGSAMVSLTLDATPRPKTITYTGDLGRRSLPLHSPPEAIPPADLLLTESTYGGRAHDTIERTTELLLEIVRRTTERGGRVIVPAFSLGRTQLLLHVLQVALRNGQLDPVPIYVDSPLGTRIVDVYREFPDSLPVRNPQEFLGEPEIEYIETREESQTLAGGHGPAIIVASSGMLEAGRILHHLKHVIDDPRASIVLVSFQAPFTLGARLKEKGPTIHFLNRAWNKWAEVYDLSGFSGHADRNDFRELFGPLAGAVGKVRLVHGESEQAEALATQLRTQGFTDIALAERGEPIPV